MKDARNIPAIRFKEFSEAWEQRKLGEIGKTYTGLSGKSKEDFGHGDARFITYLNIFTNPVADIEGVEPVEIDSKQNEVLYGDVFFTTSSETPDEVGMSSIWLGSNCNVYLNSFCFGYRLDIEVDKFYLAYALRSPSMRKKIAILAQGISRYNISKNKMMEVDLNLPSLDEQKKIGASLYELDSLITLHQRKIDALKTLKKALLAEMFPDNGSDKPLLRFKGFNDAWEQRKLEQEVIFSKGSGYSKADLSAEGLPLILYGRLYTNYESEITNVDTFAAQKTGTVFSSGNEVIVPASGETAEDIARASAVKVKGCMLGGDLNILMPKSNIDSTFLAISISNGEVSKKLACMAQGKSVVHIHNSDIEQLEIPFPSLTEQVRIVGVFRHIDTLITLYQRKLEGLKTMKTFLLQNMFI